MPTPGLRRVDVSAVLGSLVSEGSSWRDHGPTRGGLDAPGAGRTLVNEPRSCGPCEALMRTTHLGTDIVVSGMHGARSGELVMVQPRPNLAAVVVVNACARLVGCWAPRRRARAGDSAERTGSADVGHNAIDVTMTIYGPLSRKRTALQRLGERLA